MQRTGIKIMSDEVLNKQVGWRPHDWLRAAGNPFSMPLLYRAISRGEIDSRRVGRNRVILTPPLEYLEKQPRGLGPAVGRGKK
jgi:hypothetical protein